MGNAFGFIIVQSIISFANLCHQEAARLPFLIEFVLVSKAAEEASEDTFAFSVFVFVGALLYALVLMHDRSCHASQAIVLAVLASSARRFAVYAFVIQGHSASILTAVPQTVPSRCVKIKFFRTACAEVCCAAAGLALPGADLTDLLVGRRRNCNSNWTSITACVIVLAQEHGSLSLARHTIFGVDKAAGAIRITLHTQEVCSIQRHCETSITLRQACTLLEVPLCTLEVASVAIEWTAVAALARGLAGHALIQLLIRVRAERTLSLAHHAIKEWGRPIWIAGGAPVSIVVVTFPAVSVAVLAGVSRVIVKSSRWAPLDALILVEYNLVCDCVATLADSRSDKK